ncbi:tRNA (adenosine(37)-N6)-dimethylallyltransferase MiaA [Sodalis-like secondary symbiont of Drepanosiphum platanoidis]|uniref:tRNA (adenosine(37)-N6)-dimethylallyltransferase MiaA n=1 Tax=Sodalis-like secondary symbiont of Drepanosiphum platanoidis TaxID=2994493 RepID=UPI0034648B41
MSIIIFIMGPTASGKTSLSIKLFQYLPIEIISVDSALVYKYMNIGTDKPSNLILKKYPHHLINIRDPLNSYSVSEFYNDSLNKIKYIISKGKIPLLVGGTMLYFKILLEGISPLPKSNLYIRNIIKYKKKILGLKFLHNKLKLIDPKSANKIHVNDSHRIIRALEVYILSKKTLTDFYKLSKKKLPYKVFQFIIFPVNKIDLKSSIKYRFYRMLSNGFKDEVISLFNRGDLNLSLPSMKCVGYKQMWEYLSGTKTYNNMIKSVINSTYRISKNQITWIKNWKNAYILKSNESKKHIKNILSIIKN